MENYSKQNKLAWEYNAYDFWVRDSGTPAERAETIQHNPAASLKRFAKYFDRYDGIRIANICGSCGKKAVPLALLGAQVTVFDISRENRRYALELADAAGAKITYTVCDIYDIDLAQYGSTFDIVFMEGGILHYFHDLPRFMQIMHDLLRSGGRMICSDFHPFTKIMDVLSLEQQPRGYFSDDVFEGEMAHARFYPPEIRGDIPKCSYRKYTISQIINSVLGNGFILRRFDEHPAWTDPTVPGEFTLIATKEAIL